MKYLNALNKINGVGPQKIKKLLEYFGNSERAWKADANSLKASGLGEKLAEKLFFEKKNIYPENEWEKLEKENIRIISFLDPAYPKNLKEIPNPPYLLYQKGKMNLNSIPLIAIVGSRKYTAYGAQAALTLSKDLASSGVAVVSGMALGIDSFAHQGTLKVNGKTIAVLGNSLDEKNIYPKNNLNLSQEITENGLLLSEYPLETPAGPLTFPARNRIIAGLALGTVVIEAGEKSGALITAQMALDYNREVLAVPGSIFSPQSIGTNDLIKKGAKVITGIKDILEELNLKKAPPSLIKNPTSQEEKEILKILSSDPLHIDNISKITKLQSAPVSSALSLMEIKGWVKNIGGQNYISL